MTLCAGGVKFETDEFPRLYRSPNLAVAAYRRVFASRVARTGAEVVYWREYPRLVDVDGSFTVRSRLCFARRPSRRTRETRRDAA